MAGDSADVKRARAADVLTAGVLAAAATGADDHTLAIEAVLAAALGARPVDHELAAALLKEPPPVASRANRNRLVKVSCVKGLQQEALAAAQAVASRTAQVFVDGISEVEPAMACAGDPVTIRGTGFAAVPEPRRVAFPTRHGPVLVEAAEWSDTVVRAVAPDRIAPGPVGLVTVPQASAASSDAIASFAGQLVECLGPGAQQSADHFAAAAAKPLIVEIPTRDDGANRLHGGPPLIISFSVAGPGGQREEVVDIAAGETVRMDWTVEGATKIVVKPTDPGAPKIPATGQPPSTPWGQPTGSGRPTGEAAPSAEVNVGPFDGRDGDWTATYRLEASNACTDSAPVTATVEVRVTRAIAFALSGGGAKGSFQLGALRYLIDHAHLQPNILTGTSVGAINAAKLAEGHQAIDQLEDIWRGLNDESDMVQREKWLDEITNNELVQWIISIANRGFASTDGLSGADTILARPFLAINSLITGIDAAFELGELMDALKKMKKAKGLFNLGPIAEKLNDTTNLDPALVQNSGLTLRLVAVGLESGQEKWVDQDGTLIGPDGKEGTVPLPDAVLASAAIPVVFRPQALLDETFVDGGVRAVLPVEAALVAGAREIYAVSSGPGPLPVPTPRAGWNLDTIFERSVQGLLVDEVADDDLRSAEWPKATVTHIAPRVHVHDTVEVEPGLIDINVDYGFMCAADALAPAGTDVLTAESAADAITQLRRYAWELECRLVGLRPPKPSDILAPTKPSGQADSTLVIHGPGRKDYSVVPSLRDAKRRIAAFARLRAQLDVPLPDNASRWWTGWEMHRQPFPAFPADSPWDEIGRHSATQAPVGP